MTSDQEPAIQARGTFMTKDEAQREAISRWNGLPAAERKTFKQALEFAKTLEGELQFETLGNRRRIIEAWLVREYEDRAKAIQDFASRAKTGS